MEIISEIYSLIGVYLLRGIFVGVFIILVAKFLFKNKLDSDISLKIIRAVIIIHSIIYIMIFATSLLLDKTDTTFFLRAFGPHWWAYWIMISMNAFLPLTLLIKRLAVMNFYLFVVSILMNIGFLLESFVIHMTNIERDYMPEGFIAEESNPYLPTSHELSTIINGLVVGVSLLVIGNLYTWVANRKLKETK